MEYFEASTSGPATRVQNETSVQTARTTEKGVPLQLRSVGSIRLAFLLLAHRSALNVQRLLSRIHSPNHEYLVHVDVKSPEAVATGAQSFKAISVGFV